MTNPKNDGYTFLHESTLHGLYRSDELNKIFDSIDHGNKVILPFIDTSWELWSDLLTIALQRSQQLIIPVFQDEIRSYLDLFSNQEPGYDISFNIIIYKNISPDELFLLKNLKKKWSSYMFTILVNHSWHPEEVLKSLPEFIRDKLFLNFENGPIHSRFNSNEKNNFIFRARRYLLKSKIFSAPIPGRNELFNNLESMATPIKQSPLPNLYEIYQVMLSHLKSVSFFLRNNPVVFLYSLFLTTSRLLKDELFLTHFICVVLPIRIKGRANYIKGMSIHGWWKYGAPVRKIYYVLKFHYEHRKELPRKILEVFKSRKNSR